MPIAPPPGPVERFDPCYLTDADLSELSSFTGRSREDCQARVREYSMAELARAWRSSHPSTPDERLEFYRSADLYVWEQMQWHASPDRGPWWNVLQTLVHDFPPQAN